MAEPDRRQRDNPVSGALYLLRGLRLVTRKGVKRYVALPLLINILVFAGAIWWAFGQVEALQAWLTAQLPGWLEWLTWLLWPVFVLTAGLVLFFGFAVLASFIAAPFNGFLAEAVERELRGREPEGSGRSLAGEVVAAIGGELRKLLYYLKWALPLLVLTVIPGLNILAPVAWALFSAWMLAVEYGDYPMGNHGLTFPGQRRLLARRRLLALGFGGATAAALVVPVVNFLIIPVAVAGATALYVEQLAHAEP